MLMGRGPNLEYGLKWSQWDRSSVIGAFQQGVVRSDMVEARLTAH